MTISSKASRFQRGVITVAIASSAAMALSACGSKTMPVNKTQSETINRLEQRIEQLERQVGEQLPTPSDTSSKVPTGPVSSITMRTGTSDDRLRIYWADGTRSDLPCTKEQNTWACG
ncbi:hypothetical protein [Synechococcus sp. MVIR-18-1]|uniref:hypothetical protein n=1 Tax=Synechococcus sp. MVIR-18-1 TaxID=1386941 RepID=UPI0016449B22|nr:hypothetical protein [Synechococcus sp. MVIR-18-1]QNI77505.1 hypothetical protein SynMVIR181_02556 [Synechococcus sp. MVIR-18-1]